MPLQNLNRRIRELTREGFLWSSPDQYDKIRFYLKLRAQYQPIFYRITNQPRTLQSLKRAVRYARTQYAMQLIVLISDLSMQ